MVLTFYYYRRQTHNLSVGVETKVLNDLDEKVHRLNAIMIEHPELGKVMTSLPALSLETTYSFDVLGHVLTTCVKEKFSVKTSGTAGYIG
jgi:hypothetical protein